MNDEARMINPGVVAMRAEIFSFENYFVIGASYRR